MTARRPYAPPFCKPWECDHECGPGKPYCSRCCPCCECGEIRAEEIAAGEHGNEYPSEATR